MINLDLRKITTIKVEITRKNIINIDIMKIIAEKVEVTEEKIDLPGYKDDHKHYKKLKAQMVDLTRR